MTFGRACLAFTLTVLGPGLTGAQTLSTEFDVTGGYSTEGSTAASAAQLRVFGDLSKNYRLNAEATWADRTADVSDAFGAAYPYGGRVQLSEAYVERIFRPSNWLVGVRAGQYRTPFGIYTRSDYAYQGFLRAPLLRYDGYWSITNNFLERGVDVVAGTSRYQVEGSVATPGDIGEARRRGGVSATVRGQAYVKSLVVGVSRISSETYAPARFATGRLHFTGIDARVSHGGVIVRGEWIGGRYWDRPRTNGWYVDGIFHRRFMGPVTAVARAERLRYTTTRPFTYHDQSYSNWIGNRQTVGARVRLPGGFTAQAGVLRQSKVLAHDSRFSLDLAVTYSVRRD
ncbi:MAG TPA: hypothetical protein VMF13_00945 [Luteitalea sp.]|nr:hypothetical protein [Luteitalea sp.]